MLPAFEKTAKAYTMKATPKKHGGKDGRKSYKLESGDRWTCTCPDFIYRRQKDGSDCKHITAKKTGKKPWVVKSLRDKAKLDTEYSAPESLVGGDVQSATTKSMV